MPCRIYIWKVCMHMSLDKRFTKPPKDNPHAVFLYGVECGIEQERERIVSILENYWDEPCGEPFDPEHCVYCGTIGDIITIIKGENE